MNSQSERRSPTATALRDTVSMSIACGPLMCRCSRGSSRSRLPAAGSTMSAYCAVGVMKRSCTTSSSSLFSASMTRAVFG